MAQEFRVGGNEVLLSLSPEYRSENSNESTAEAAAALLGAVQRFKPFVDYLTSFKAPAECDITTVVVKNIGQIGGGATNGRISSITCDVTLRHSKTNKSITQPIHLESDAVPAVVLPVLEVADADEANNNNNGGGDKKQLSIAGRYAVLFPRARLALGAKVVLDCPTGFFEVASGDKKSAGKPLQITNGISQADLERAGFTPQHLTEKMCTPLSTSEDIITGYEGQVPVRVMASKRSCTAADVEEMLAEMAEFSLQQQQQSTTSATAATLPPLVLVPLEDVASRTSDINAVLAASLLL